MFNRIKVHSAVILVLSLCNVRVNIRNIDNHQNETKTPEQKQKWNAYLKLYKKKRSEKKNPDFECENQTQSSCTVGNLTTGCQSEICVLTVLCIVYQTRYSSR